MLEARNVDIEVVGDNALARIPFAYFRNNDRNRFYDVKIVRRYRYIDSAKYM